MFKNPLFSVSDGEDIPKTSQQVQNTFIRTMVEIRVDGKIWVSVKNGLQNASSQEILKIPSRYEIERKK